jgi:drug/metabolite transporter (DMT)-like permease
MGLLTLGGMLLILDRAERGGGTQVLGLLAVAGATASWGLDNALSRPLAARDPGQVVMFKGAAGVLLTVLLAFAFGETAPRFWPALALFAIGATGYGLSLRFYLLAQRAFGAARTGSVFAFAPFVGAAFAIVLGEHAGGAWTFGGAVLMLIGLALHLAEKHAHEHQHVAMEHEHAHTHDDGHHDHLHTPMPAGPHSHAHHHAPISHAHLHVPDEHHAHRH